MINLFISVRMILQQSNIYHQHVAKANQGGLYRNWKKKQIEEKEKIKKMKDLIIYSLL